MANLSNINNKFIVTSETEALIGATSWAGVGSGTLAAGLVISGNTSQFILDNPTYNHFTIYSASDSNIYNVFGSSGNYLIGTGNKDTSSWSEKMRIDSSGNVGIGNTSPSSFNTLGGKQVVIGDGTQTNNLTLFSATTGGSVGYGHIAFADSNTSSSSAQYAGLIQYYHGNDSMQFYTDATPRLTILNNGNVGIGTSSPDGKLQVTAASSTTSNGNDASFKLYLTNTDTTNNNYSLINFTDSDGGSSSGGMGLQYTDHANNYGDLCFITRGSGGYGERMRITSGGDVYIGNSSVTLANTAIFLQKNGIITNVVASNSTDLIQFYQQNTGALGTISRNANGICINGIGQTNQLVVGDSGVVSLGTTSPITDPFVSSNQFQQFQVGKSGVMGSYTNSAGEAMFSNNMYVGSTYNTFQALDTSVNATAMFLYNDYIAFKCGTTAANGTVSVPEQMRLTNAGELNIGGYGGQFPILKVVGLAGGVHTGSTWSISANQDGIGRTILGTGGQGRAMYFENDGKTVHTQESYFDKGVYLGGSVAANLLDDYEEGTFYATTNNDGVGAQFISRYTKIGQLVTYTVYLQNWAPLAAGNAIVGGFPFTAITSYGYGVGNVTHSTGILNCAGGYHAGTAWYSSVNNGTASANWVVAANRYTMISGFYYTAA